MNLKVEALAINFELKLIEIERDIIKVERLSELSDRISVCIESLLDNCNEWYWLEDSRHRMQKLAKLKAVMSVHHVAYETELKLTVEKCLGYLPEDYDDFFDEYAECYEFLYEEDGSFFANSHL